MNKFINVTSLSPHVVIHKCLLKLLKDCKIKIELFCSFEPRLDSLKDFNQPGTKHINSGPAELAISTII